MICVHHLENSRSKRVPWLLEELGTSYRIIEYQRDPKSLRAPASLREVHPLGKSPLISDESRGGRVVAESGAIIEYLLDHHDPEGRLRPPAGSDAHERYRHWLHHAEGSAMPPLVMRLVFSRLGKPPVPALIRPLGRQFAKGVEQQFLGPEIEALMQYWEDALEQTPWFAGDAFSACDIQMSFPLLALESGQALADYPRLQGFLTRCRERDAYRRAVEKGGEFGAIGG
ncbi:glutathione S-transferase [Halomonas campisalis]|uniref:Glutathione S-transferase n=1 Tax=Billgrantia campisalis TaxID=74661 RepID=A0ABS9P326_9GAMM|nr:glutathione S-transferase [Halomonas campisalis]MCG6656181.1 glutathione S-transferase [Halomonas campisalis]MDR5861367.1 glutathione S-transferase [Halomonas campisalis]